VSLRDVSFAYAEHEVLRQVTLELAASETVAVMGPSGSGKSTLLAVAGMLEQPATGSVSYAGMDTSTCGRNPRLRRLRAIGWVFQSANALGQRSAVDNVALPLISRGQTHLEARAHASEALRTLGIIHLAHQRAATLSGGELQRVCVARAMVTRPDIIIADEPTAQLDSTTSKVVIDNLKQAAALGSCVLIATHDAEVAARADRVVRLLDGRLR